MKNLTIKSFKTSLNAMLKRGQALRDDVQSFINFGVEYYNESEENNGLYLTELMKGLNQIKTVPSEVVKDYILATCPSLQYMKNKKGEAIFKHKKGADKKVAPLMDGDKFITWYDYHKNNKVQSEWNLDRYLATVAKTLEKHGYVGTVSVEPVTEEVTAEELENEIEATATELKEVA